MDFGINVNTDAEKNGGIVSAISLILQKIH